MNNSYNGLIGQHIGKRLHEIRQRQRLTTLETMVDRLGISFDNLEAWEEGEKVITAVELYRLGKYYDYPIEYFFPDYRVF